MIHYRYSHSVSAAELKKWGVFTTIEVRNHNQEELAYQGSRDFVEDVSRTWDYEILWKSSAQKNGHLIALCVPKCFPERLALLSAIYDLSFLQDGSWHLLPHFPKVIMRLTINQTFSRTRRMLSVLVLQRFFFITKKPSTDGIKGEC